MVKKYLIIVATAIILLVAATQVLIMKHMFAHAIVLWIVMIAILGLSFLKNIRVDFSKEWMPEIMSVFSLIMAIIATVIVKSMPRIALILYIAAAVLLFFSKPKKTGYWEQGQLKNQRNTFEKWEPWFFAFLLLYTIALRFPMLGDIPAGIAGQEMTQMSDIGIMEGDMKGYHWHGGGGDEWPSMTMYQALGFMKVFGNNIGSLRLPSAAWDTLYVIAMYFLVRLLFSPAAAAFTSFLFSSNVFQITMSRQLTPFAIMYAAMLMSTWMFITAIRNKKWYFFCLSGFALGITLHGYMPGRIIPGIFALWCIYLWIFRRDMGLKLKHFAIVLGGFLISAGPIIVFATMQPNLYWGYFQSVNPNSRGKIMDYIMYFIGNIHHYAGAFHIKGDMSPSYTVPCKNMLEPVAETLFPLGLFLCVFMLFTPVGMYLAVFFLLSLVPAMLGTGGTGHPGLTRMSGVFSSVYIMIAFAFERLRNVFKDSGNKYKKAAFAAVMLLAAVFGAYNGVHEYFFETTNNREFRVQQRYGEYLANKAMSASPAERIVVSRMLLGYFTPKKVFAQMIAVLPEDFLLLDRSVKNLLLIEPYLEGITPYLKEFFPDADIKIYTEPKENIGKYCFNAQAEVFNPYNYISIADIPVKDITAFQSLTDIKTGEKVDVSDKTCAEKYAGRHIALKGAFILRESEEQAELKINWPGWKIISNGRTADNKSEFNVCGVNYFTIEGTVPGDATGQIPLELFFKKGGTIKNRFFSTKENYGFRTKYYKNVKGPFNVKPDYYKNIIFPYYRFFDGYCGGLKVSFMVVLEGYVRAIKDCDTAIKVETPCYAKVMLDGKIVQDSITGEPAVIPVPISLKKGETHKVTVYFTAFGGEIDRTFIMKLPDSVELLMDR